jgi:general stress protein CsbA
MIWSIPTEVEGMLVAADYPFLNILWTMIIFFAWVAWIWLLILILSDVFRRDISGWAKAGWTLFLIVLPFLGAFIYLIVQGSEMTARRVHDPRVSQAHPGDYAGPVGGNVGAASEIEKAKRLLDSGAITQSEFEALKVKALA